MPSVPLCAPYLSVYLLLTLLPSLSPLSILLYFFPHPSHTHRTPPRCLVFLVYYARVSILSGARLIEIGAVKRPHRQAIPVWSASLEQGAVRRLRFDEPLPELATPWRAPALGFPVNEAQCGRHGCRGLRVEEKKKRGNEFKLTAL